MRGFTLLELMITVAILAVLTTVSVSALGPLRARYNRRQAAELVASAAARMRLEARETGRCHAFQVYNGGTAVALGTPGDRIRLVRLKHADCESTPTSTDLEEVEWVRMPEPARVRVVSGSEVVFRPNGRLLNGNGELRLAAGGRELIVQLRVQGPICINDVTGPCP
jgi:prepilin-type N-terminal cleavage/methylation domain-containing protein